MYLVDIDIKKYTKLPFDNGNVIGKVKSCKEFLESNCRFFNGEKHGEFQGDGGLYKFHIPESSIRFIESYFNFVDYLNENEPTFYINAAVKKVENVQFPIEENIKNPELDSFGHISKEIFKYEIPSHIFWICEKTYADSSEEIRKLFSPVPRTIDEDNQRLITIIYRYNPLKRSIFINNAPRILVLGAHCDDIELGCSGTLALLRDCYNAEIFYRVLSCANVSPSGSKTPDFELRCVHAIQSANMLLYGKEVDPDEASKLATKFREDHNRKTMILQNVEYLKNHKILITNYYDDMNFDQSLKEIRDELNELYNQIKPDIVIGPSLVDLHQDHMTLAQSIFQKFRKTNIWQYISPDTGAILGNFTPNIFIRISEECKRDGIYSKIEDVNNYFELKLKLLYYFKTEYDRNWFYDENFTSLCIVGSRTCHYPKHENSNNDNLSKSECFVGVVKT